MTQRIVDSANNPNRGALERARAEWSSDWRRATKVEFSLIGGEHLKMSVMMLVVEEYGLTIKGFLESGEVVEVFMNSMTGTGTATTLPAVPRSSYSFLP